MTHYAAPEFWERFHALPPAVQVLAEKTFAILKANPRHPSLHFKKVGRFQSARVGLHYRALAVDVPDGLLWLWIGSHAEYDVLVR